MDVKCVMILLNGAGKRYYVGLTKLGVLEKLFEALAAGSADDLRFSVQVSRITACNKSEYVGDYCLSGGRLDIVRMRLLEHNFLDFREAFSACVEDAVSEGLSEEVGTLLTANHGALALLYGSPALELLDDSLSESAHVL